ncbi:hypothetical protein OOK60_10995 [Trichothermofontia sichuanensis B231]|uniref:hypothetical protein n=1 Tax=Trichothermofontia sichuanensis TaxID=3045816 RepID=UPI002245B686|nr:hypothetical protein [Trichothermofontia sichuanensis]UZQ53047.1 hypothetical protein OOK60_10995 [Trichothermofontia sichuanensis B231]
MDVGVAIAAVGRLAGWLSRPAYAHKTEVSGDVAGIWHLEPNHSPKAGEPAQVWIALTQAGGKVIPLKDCDCRLTVYAGPTIAAPPLLEPPLVAIAAEQYQGIPGATLIFPAVGQYFLQLTGKPQAGATFQPFALSYTVTVAAGQSPAPAIARSPSPPSPSPAAAAVPLVSPHPGAGWLGVGVLLSLAVGLWLGRRRPPLP